MNYPSSKRSTLYAIRYTLYAVRSTSFENPTLAHFSHFSSLFTNLPAYKALYLRAYKAPDIYVPIRHYICRESSTNQLLFMQNKPNVKYAQINVNSYIKGIYEILDTWLSGKNKPNSNPIKPNFKKAKTNVNSLITKDYRKKDDFLVRINKPNFRNGQNERNCLYHKGLQKKRLFSSPKNKPNSNPIKPCPERSRMGQFLQRPKSLTKKSGHALVIQGLIFSLIRYSLGGIITPVGGTKKQRSRRLLTTFFFSSVKTEQKVGIIS